MSNSELPTMKGESMTVETSLDAQAIKCLFKGTADLRVGTTLQELLRDLHNKAMELGVKNVNVDFQNLEFMNSSCFKSFVTWLSDVQDLPSDRQYAIRFHSNPEFLWQRRSLHALRCFAAELVTVDN